MIEEKKKSIEKSWLFLTSPRTAVQRGSDTLGKNFPSSLLFFFFRNPECICVFPKRLGSSRQARRIDILIINIAKDSRRNNKLIRNAIVGIILRLIMVV